VKAQTYSFEAANVRHEHEWRVWQQEKLPAGKMLMPGVVSHATNLVEHPQLVADRILRYAQIAYTGLLDASERRGVRLQSWDWPRRRGCCVLERV
jgi:5-methyltetrahydropteroyltriglutamate--homocysteine methyltransferase